MQPLSKRWRMDTSSSAPAPREAEDCFIAFRLLRKPLEPHAVVEVDDLAHRGSPYCYAPRTWAGARLFVHEAQRNTSSVRGMAAEGGCS